MTPLLRAALGGLLLLSLAGVGCRSADGGSSRWDVPKIIATDRWWGENELGGVDR